MEEQKIVPMNVKRNALEQSLFYFGKKEPFYAAFLQEIIIKYVDFIPTAAITYNKKQDQFEMYLNAGFFCPMPLEQRIAILHHETLHFTHQHLFRIFGEQFAPETHKTRNIAADMAINQFISDLPPGGVDVKEFKLNDGTPFPLFKTAEDYYELLKNNQEGNKEKMKQFGEGGEGTDTHIWDQLTEEEKEKILKEAKKVIKRSIEKTSMSHDRVPDSIKDLLQEIDAAIAGIDHKGILKRAIKRTLSSMDREGTWNKPSKRYGVYSPGTRVGKIPNITFYGDTSGSISHNELNQFFSVVDGFLRVGSKTCFLGLWHTNLYYKKRYKLGMKLQEGDLQSGGTDPECVLEDIIRTNPNLSIVLTDGCYSDSAIKPLGEVIWVISKGGNKDHPLAHIGVTIALDKIVS